MRVPPKSLSPLTCKLHQSISNGRFLPCSASTRSVSLLSLSRSSISVIRQLPYHLLPTTVTIVRILLLPQPIYNHSHHHPLRPTPYTLHRAFLSIVMVSSSWSFQVSGSAALRLFSQLIILAANNQRHAPTLLLASCCL